MKLSFISHGDAAQFNTGDWPFSVWLAFSQGVKQSGVPHLCMVPHLCTLFSAHWLVHPLKKTLSLSCKCFIYLWSIVGYLEKKKSNIGAPLLKIPCFHWIRPKPFPFIFAKCFPFVICEPSLNIYIDLLRKSFSLIYAVDQMNISLACLLLMERPNFSA